MSNVKSIGISNMLDIMSGSGCLYVPSRDEEQIKELLIGHSVKKVDNYTLELDNGIQLEFEGNNGCSCGAGCYDITQLNECNNVITDVEFEEKDLDENDMWSCKYRYEIFVYAEDTKLKLLQCDGDDGNGYYGTGYHIRVKQKEED